MRNPPTAVERARRAAATKKWRQNNLERAKELAKRTVAKWRKDNPALYRAQHLRRVYGMTLAEHDSILAAQGNKCATCPATEAGGRGNTWHVDHDHETGRVRGILCRGCNTALGLIKDSAATLRALADYVERQP